ncbi:MFS transporter, partial [Pseudomonas aeruginosa]
VVFALGLAIAAVVPTGPMLVLGIGVLVGIGISCTSFGVVLTAVGRGAPAEKRSMAMGIASAGGSLGQVALVPIAQWFTSHSGTMVSLFVLAGCMIAIAPLGVLLDKNTRGSHVVAHETATISLKETLSYAVRHRGYCLLTLGFFTCGFQLAFIGTHLPNYLLLCHMPAGLGATA